MSKSADFASDENLVAAAGALVSKDVPPNSVVGGVPATFLKTLDEQLQKPVNGLVWN